MYPSSHPPQQPSHRLPLAKFSHTATSIGHNGPLNWNHIIGNGDLELIFEKNTTNGALSGRTLLKVLQDHHTWEELDLDRLIQEASNTNQKPLSAVIVRLPCIAVKYPNGQLLRRFQVKFTSDRDYYSALTILSEMQCPFSESNIGPPQLGRKLTSSSWNTGLGIGSFSGASSAALQPNSSTACSSGTMPNILRPHSASSFSSHIQTEFTRPVDTQSHSIQKHQMPTPLNSCASSSTISRPSTATQPYDPEAFNKTLPPKRSLPFATPGAKKPRTAAKAKQPNPSQPDPNKPTPSPIEQPPTPPISNTLTFPSSRMTQPYQSIQPGGSIEYPFVPSKSDKGLLTSADLTAYLSNPTDERTAIIQNWFSNLIQDDAFLQLCQDVEGAWGRIALGKRVD